MQDQLKKGCVNCDLFLKTLLLTTSKFYILLCVLLNSILNHQQIFTILKIVVSLLILVNMPV